MNEAPEASAPLLSIWIPTFNRVDYLTRLLGSLYSQSIEFIDSGVLEIIVSDNCSQDSTEQLCEQSFEKLEYRKQIVNVGFDRNFSLGFSECAGEFIWTIGDDDLIQPGAVANILRKLRDQRSIEDISLVKLPVKIIGESQEKSADTPPSAGEFLALNALEAISICGLDELMRMSSSIYRRADSKRSDKDPGGRGWNVSPLEHALFALGKGKVLLLPHPYVFCNEGAEHRQTWRPEWNFIANLAMPFVLLENRVILRRKHGAHIPILFFRKGFSLDALSDAHKRMGVLERLRVLPALLTDSRFYQFLIVRALRPLKRFVGLNSLSI